MIKIISSIQKKLEDSPLLTDPKYEKYKMFFVPALVLIFAILISVLVTVPQLYKLFNTFKTIEELKSKKLFYQAKAVDLDQINLESYRKDLDTALIALPVEKDIPGVMGEILVILGGSGMSLNGITFSSAPAGSEKGEEYTVIIQAAGSEQSLQNFLDRVTLAPRLMKLTSIQLDKGISGNITANFTLATFYQSLPGSAGAIDEDLPKITSEDTQILADIKVKINQFPKATTQDVQTTTATGKTNPFAP